MLKFDVISGVAGLGDVGVQVRLLVCVSGDGWTVHKENGVSYCFDVTRCMFASGNGTERLDWWMDRLMD